MRTLAVLVAGGLVGVVSGTATVLVHSSWWWLTLGVAAGLTTAAWLSGAARVGFALGWGAAVSGASVPRPEGDYLVSAQGTGWALLVSSLALVVGALVSVPRAAGRPRDQRSPGVPS